MSMSLLSYLSPGDVLFSAFSAFIATFFIVKLPYFYKLMKDDTHFVDNPSNYSRILEKCFSLFPVNELEFLGATFKKGDSVRLTTKDKKIIEGLFVGLNKHKDLCVITRTFISAQNLDNVAEITHVR